MHNSHCSSVSSRNGYGTQHLTAYRLLGREHTAFAAERDQMFGVAGIATHPKKPVLQTARNGSRITAQLPVPGGAGKTSSRLIRTGRRRVAHDILRRFDAGLPFSTFPHRLDDEMQDRHQHQAQHCHQKHAAEDRSADGVTPAAPAPSANTSGSTAVHTESGRQI
jgi:hypothetical protein